jgi:hypothetical protein
MLQKKWEEKMLCRYFGRRCPVGGRTRRRFGERKAVMSHTSVARDAFANSRLSSLVLLVATAFAVGPGCSRAPLDDGGDAGLAQVVLALDVAPADVRCVVVTASSDHADVRAFGVTPGKSTVFTLPRLPVGIVVFSVEAFATACGAAGADPAPTWVGGPSSVLLRPGANGPFAIAMRRNGAVKVSVDFDGGAAAPVCAALGSACVSDGDCCNGKCIVDAANATGVGVCQAAMVPPPPPPPPPPPAPPDGPKVDVTLTAEKSYLFFSTDGGPGCGDDSAGTYTVSIPASQTSVCISTSVGDVVPVPVDDTQVCSAGDVCQSCQDDSCQPSSCFKPAPIAAAGAPCAHRLNALPGKLLTTYVLLRRIDVKKPPARPEGLPRLITLGKTSVITVTPPADQPTFAVTRLGPPLVQADNAGDMCGGLSLCGIVPYQAFGGFLFPTSWYFGGGSLFSSPLF